jgi:uncharacterized integral membrane protein
MYLRTVLILLVLGSLALFAAVNWGSFTTPTTLSLLFTTIEAPLGLILLASIVLLAALFLLYVVYLQSSVLIESRRHARELHAQRELAEEAERSRFHDLRSLLEKRLDAVVETTERSKTELLARIDGIEQSTRSAVGQCENTVAAYMAQLEDRLERALGEARVKIP